MRFERPNFLLVAAPIAAAIVLPAQPAANDPSAPYHNAKLGVEQRVRDLPGRMTLEEKLTMLSGTGFDSRPASRLREQASQDIKRRIATCFSRRGFLGRE